MLNAIKAVQIVTAAKQRKPSEYKTTTFFGRYDFWVYLPIYDEKLCHKCEAHAKTLFFKGSQLRSTFPWLEIVDENTINVKVHINCRCELLRVTTFEQYIRVYERFYGA